MEMALGMKPKARYKTFTYMTKLQWVGKRAGILGSADKEEFSVSSPPEFQGEEGIWTPEDLFVGSINACMMTSFVSFAERLQLSIISYSSTAQGILEFLDGNYRFTRIILRPHVIVQNASLVEGARRTLDVAHEKCLIANSILSDVIIEPIIEVQE